MKKITQLLVFVLVATLAAVPVLAVDAPPAFPACADKIFTQDGDHAHYEYGLHQIVGGPLLTGADDVYTLETGNYLQCYCPSIDQENQTGIQTDWWQLGEIGPAIIDNYLNQGWLYVANGASWNLNNGPYLAKNSNFSCSTDQDADPTPTPTVTETEGEISPTPTPTLAPTSVGQVQSTSVSAPGPASAPHCPDPQPTPPLLLAVSKSGPDGVELVWSPVVDAKYYVISYGLESGKPQFGIPDVGNVSSYRVGGLDLARAKYYFRVAVVKGCQVSELSNELSYPHAIGGQVSGLAATGTDFNQLKWLGIAIAGLAALVLGRSGETTKLRDYSPSIRQLTGSCKNI